MIKAMTNDEAIALLVQRNDFSQQTFKLLAYIFKWRSPPKSPPSQTQS
ncbi:MAG: hypothetical protein HC799_02840 [Limnothrix sp. RL_2_0]|nr:hypothetical protein [Limnothrix sp. RL_2_0]